MPIYTYRCESCGVQFERHQSFNDQPLTRCPECNKNKLRKVITPAGIVFKGSGWYATDHKSKPAAAKPAAVKAGGEAKSESKDAAPVAVSESGSSSSSSADSSASKSDPSAAKSSSSE